MTTGKKVSLFAPHLEEALGHMLEAKKALKEHDAKTADPMFDWCFDMVKRMGGGE